MPTYVCETVFVAERLVKTENGRATMKRLRHTPQRESSAGQLRRIIQPPSLEDVESAVKIENGGFIPCGLEREQLENLNRIIPELPPSACRRLDRLVYFWKIARDDASNATSPQEALENTQTVCQLLDVAAQSLDELLANEVAARY
ncbi:hypothetical protein [Methylobacterium radiotolerans]|uniref:hypothetical protein n=1 Tax=Methylobacterium radiotolerans TaxID=31998 RepID=UPI0015F3D475|nr:hypothetical protein [Methylobacterium radiotolerans]